MVRANWRATWLATAAMALAAPAFAQAPAAPSAADDEIIVTAQKREERLQDVPISINVQSGDVLERAGISTFFELQARVPNLVINDTPANASISIRGVGTTGNTLSFEQSVSLFVDGIYGGRNRQFMQPFFDVERIEVLRGPQGALFGRNTSAGAISVTTRRPSQTFEGRAFVDREIVRNSTYLEMAAGGPVTDTLSGRFAIRYANVNGWLDNTTLNRTEPDRDDVLARASLLWEPSERISVFGKVEYASSDIVGAGFEFVPGGTRPDYQVDHDDAYAPLRDKSEAVNATLQIDIGLGSHTLTSITGYTRYDYENGFNIQARRPARLVVENAEDFSQWSQEIRLSSAADRRLRYIFGGYVEGSSSDIERITFVDTPAPPALNNRNTRDFVQDVDVLAFFGQADYDLTERLNLAVGLRWTRTRKDGGTDGINQTFNPPTGATSVIVPRVPLNGEIDEDDLSPTATLSWRAVDWVNLYFRYAEGSKGGAFSETATFLKDFLLEPEQARAFELGAKIDVTRLRGFVNIALYRTNYEDLQKSSLDVANAVFVTTNAAGARVQGVEVESAFRLADWLRAGASVAYLDAVYTDYPNGPCAFPRHVIPNCQEDRSGDRLQNAPKWSGSVYADIDAPLNDRLRAFGNWTTSFRSDTNYQDILHPLEVQEAFSKTDLRAGIGGAERQWELAILVRNLFDKRTSGQIFQTFAIGTLPDDRVHLPDPRRSITLQGRIYF
jgi:iron complex outermembrane receptor protein